MFRNKEACPACRERGQDRHGDNLARYTDGSAYCFACGYKERPTIYRGEKKVKPTKSLVLEDDMPVKNMDWLRQYITPSEIRQYFKYSPIKDAHVFTHIDHEGKLYYEARSVDPKKVESGGQKPYFLIGKGSHLVVVEDLISAIKVSRHTLALPLFGSHMPNEWIAQATRNPQIERISYWLDYDKRDKAIEYARKTALLIPHCNVIFTEKDPKAYDNEEIEEFLKK